MLFYIVLCFYFLALLAPNIATNVQPSSEEEKPEPIFVDVIKNITRVNNELQELIHNYKLIKKKTYLQDDFEVKENVEEKKTPSDGNVTTSVYPTQMIFIEEGEKSSEGENNSPAEVSSEADKSHEGEKSKAKKPQSNEIEKPETEKKELKEHKNITDKSNETEESIEPIDSTDSKEKPMYPKDRQRSKDKPSEPKDAIYPKEEKLIEPKDSIRPKVKILEPIEPIVSKEKLIEPKELTGSKEEVEEKKKLIMPEALTLQKEAPGPKKTRYSVKGTPAKKINKTSSQPPPKDNSFAASEDEELADASKLTEQSNEATTAKFTVGIYLRTANGTNTTKKPDNAPPEVKSNTDEALSKDFIKTSALRLAYGDACLKLVIRKCYKASKTVLKTSCRSSRCKSDFKEFFDTTARKGCIEAFDIDSKKASEVGLRRIDTTARINNSMTREDLSPACLTRIAAPTLGLPTNNTVVPKANATQDESLNILRDKYEKACQKVSRNKCRTACNGAGDATCEKFECKKSLKKRFKRNCKSQCKIAFSGSSSTTDSSDSSTESDTETESETETETETESVSESDSKISTDTDDSHKS